MTAMSRCRRLGHGSCGGGHEQRCPTYQAHVGQSQGPRCPRSLVKVTPVPTSMATTSGVKLISAATIKPRPIDWLWDAHLARGKLSILAGVPGTGKSTVAFNLAAIVSIGGAWPDGSRCLG